MKYKNIFMLGILLVFGLSVCQVYAVNKASTKTIKVQKSKKIHHQKKVYKKHHK